MATVQRFEDLEVWELARQLSKEIDDLTCLPPLSGDFRLRNQIRGSAGAIMDNIAEGFERNSRNEFINSLSIAKGEAGEVKSQLYRALDISYIASEKFKELYSQTDIVSRKLAAFILYLNSTEIKGQKFKDRVK